jgi:hypothetical protein
VRTPLKLAVLGLCLASLFLAACIAVPQPAHPKDTPEARRVGTPLVVPSEIPPESTPQAEATLIPEGCQGNADCPPGQVCRFNGCMSEAFTVGAICLNDEDCERGQKCLDKQCTVTGEAPIRGEQCTGASQCPHFEECVDHRCQLRPGMCGRDQDCECQQICSQNHYCVEDNACQSDSDCPWGLNCHCYGECRCDRHCNVPGAKVCSDRDVVICAQGSHGCYSWKWYNTCPMGQRCNGGSCVPCVNECNEDWGWTECPDGGWAERHHYCWRDRDGCWQKGSWLIPCGGNGTIGVCQNNECWVPGVP